MTLFWERRFPEVLSFIFAAVFYNFPVQFPAEVKDILAASISFGAITAGFIATAISILMALPSDSVMARIKSSGYVNDLVSYLRKAFYSSLLYSLFCLASFLFQTHFNLCFKTAWILLTAMSFLTLYQVANLMLAILRK
ncbi:hypothetical protein AAFM71_10945 [Chromobacterium violaceum]|uniref:hypothetical protein n=1 Tax=Chromobacterium violaceum TaxID=536 RepID=UPI003859F4A1